MGKGIVRFFVGLMAMITIIAAVFALLAFGVAFLLAGFSLGNTPNSKMQFIAQVLMHLSSLSAGFMALKYLITRSKDYLLIKVRFAGLIYWAFLIAGVFLLPDKGGSFLTDRQDPMLLGLIILTLWSIFALTKKSDPRFRFLGVFVSGLALAINVLALILIDRELGRVMFLYGIPCSALLVSTGFLSKH